jgi:hypothetical protein
LCKHGKILKLFDFLEKLKVFHGTEYIKVNQPKFFQVHDDSSQGHIMRMYCTSTNPNDQQLPPPLSCFDYENEKYTTIKYGIIEDRQPCSTIKKYRTLKVTNVLHYCLAIG